MYLFSFTYLSLPLMLYFLWFFMFPCSLGVRKLSCSTLEFLLFLLNYFSFIFFSPRFNEVDI
jgi:hypothetical protein